MIRRSMACGFEPKTPDGVAWRFGEFARDAPEASTCIGYLRLLPEVDEIARAWLHWSKGQIVVALGGEMPNPKLRAGVEIFDAAINAVSAWRMTPREEGGGR